MLAKLTPPTLPKIVPRPRLFRELDRARKRSIVWITAPPGAGKTTLVASYLKAKRLPCVWYQVDEGDADPATLFYYLCLAGESRSRRRKPSLPLLTAEYRPGLSVYARRFFESLFARLSTPAAVIFDNFQLIPAASEVHEALASAFETIPPGITVFVLSRQPTPPIMASLHAKQRIALFSGEPLRLREEEARQVVQLHRGPRVTSQDERAIGHWYQQTNGWMAGLILLLNTGGRGPRDEVLSTTETPQVVFDYLAQEVLGQLAPDIQRVLWTTAFAPSVTEAMAVSLSGIAEAGVHLQRLARGGYFTEQRAGDQPTYQYHSLWRTFLQQEACRLADPESIHTVQQRTAALFEEAGQIDAAIELWLTAQEWAQTTTLLLTHAPTFMQDGRMDTLARWIQTLPPAVREQTPWLQFWLGNCLSAVNPQEALRVFEQAALQFEAAGDLAGHLLTLAVLIEMTIYAGRDWRPLHIWAETILDLTKQGTQFPSAEIECRVTLAVSNAMIVMGRGMQAEIWSKRAIRLLQTSQGTEAMLHVGPTLMLWLFFTGRQQEANTLLAALDHERQKNPGNLLSEIRYLCWFCMWGWQVCRFAETCEAAEHGLDLGENSGLYHFTTPFQVSSSYAVLSMRDRHRWNSFAKRLPDLLEKCPSMFIQTHAIRLQAAFALLEGDMGLAKLLLTRERSSFQGKGYDDILQMLWIPPLLHLCYRTGQYAEMEAEWMTSITWRHHPLALFDAWHYYLIQSCIREAQGRCAEALQILREGLKIGRECQFFALDWPMQDEVATCCAIALEKGIEVDYVRELIRRLNLVPPEQARASTTWPWAIRVQTLGRFAIIIDDKPVHFGRKVPRVPLMLLQAIIAHGGQAVATATLCDLLWPEADGDAAYRSMKMALSRLRTILKHSDALILRDGHLSLNPMYCWVDALAFEQVAKDSLILLGQGQQEKGGRQATYASILYGGEFLPHASEIPWTHPCRARLTRLAARCGHSSPHDAL